MDIMDSIDNSIGYLIDFYSKHVILLIITLIIFILCIIHPLLLIGIFLGGIFMFYVHKYSEMDKKYNNF